MAAGESWGGASGRGGCEGSDVWLGLSQFPQEAKGLLGDGQSGRTTESGQDHPKVCQGIREFIPVATGRGCGKLTTDLNSFFEHGQGVSRATRLNEQYTERGEGRP